MPFSSRLRSDEPRLSALQEARLAILESAASRPEWPVLALPRHIARSLDVSNETARSLLEGCGLFFAAADVIDDAQDGDLAEGIDWALAVNCGLSFLFASLEAFEEAAPGLPVGTEISRAGARLVVGQARDLGLTWNARPAEEAVLEAIKGKTGASVALYCRMAGWCGGLSVAEIDLLGELGERVGTAVQLRTDLIDLSHPSSRDLRAHKATLPIAYTIRHAHDRFEEAASSGDAEDIRRVVRATGAVTFTEFQIASLVHEAKELAGRIMPSPEGKNDLVNLIERATASALAL